MKRLIKKSNWIDGPYEKQDPYKQYIEDYVDDYGTTYMETGILSLNDIKDLKGYHGEDHKWQDDFFGKYSKKEWEKFLNDIKQNGIKEPIEITVNENGKKYVLNGNHRLQAAIQLGLNEIPVIIKYLNNSQEKYKI